MIPELDSRPMTISSRVKRDTINKYFVGASDGAYYARDAAAY